MSAGVAVSSPRVDAGMFSASGCSVLGSGAGVDSLALASTNPMAARDLPNPTADRVLEHGLVQSFFNTSTRCTRQWVYLLR
jgi:hypothetical protein